MTNPIFISGPDFIGWQYVINTTANRAGRVLQEFDYAYYVDSPFFGETLWHKANCRNPTDAEIKKIVDSFGGAKEAKKNIDHAGLDDFLKDLPK